jgi:phosphoribosylamine--glycine ligase
VRILVIGEGGRETAICRALSTATPAPELVIAPGNAGTARFGRNVPVPVKDLPGLVALARAEKVDLVIPGGETSLVLGVADALTAAGIPCCGPSRAAAQLEGSKIFTRELAAAVGAPSPAYAVTRREAELAWALDAWLGAPPVVKADGLAGGKGVFLPDSKAEALAIGRRLFGGELGDAGREIVLEERLVGVEASLFYACDGKTAVLLPHARDHKRVGDGDKGPNTGGMGAISPNPDVTPELEARVRREVVLPVLAELQRRGTPFVGFLYAGLMLTAAGPKLLEFNARLGDPETQAVLPRLTPGAFLELCLRTAKGELDGFSLGVQPGFTCAVVLAAGGYPETPRLGETITVAADAEDATRWIDFAGVASRGGALVTAGGRVMAVVGKGASAPEARAAAYAGVPKVSFAGMHHRRDIGGSGS